MSDDRQAQLKNVLLNMDEVPALPVALATILNLMRDEDVSIKELERAILQDPAITTRVLSLANSAFYGYRRKISTISQGIVVLGLNTVRNMVLGVYMVDGFRLGKGKNDAFDSEAFWLHCVSTATVSGIIAKRCGGIDNETSWIAGLLHDLGKMVFNFGMNDRYPRVVQRCRDEQLPLRVVEDEELGGNHALVGEWMSARWQLPEAIGNVIRYHHEPQLAPADQALVSAVHLANILVKQEQLGDSGDPIVPKIVPITLTHLGVGVPDIKELLAETRAKSEEIRDFHRLLL